MNSIFTEIKEMMDFCKVNSTLQNNWQLNDEKCNGNFLCIVSKIKTSEFWNTFYNNIAILSKI